MRLIQGSLFTPHFPWMLHVQCPEIGCQGWQTRQIFAHSEGSEFSHTPLKSTHTSNVQPCSTENTSKILHMRRLGGRRCRKGKEVLSWQNNIIGQVRDKIVSMINKPQSYFSENMLSCKALHSLWETGYHLIQTVHFMWINNT